MQYRASAPKVLITGGLGHIGSRLIRSVDYNMTVADDLSTERYSSLFDFRASTEHEITFWPRNFSDLIQEELSQFDIIIHLAAKTDAAASFGNRDDIERVNVDQTLGLIDRAEAAGVQLFIFPSSTSVYGVAKDIMIEDDPSYINPQSPYAESKIVIEHALQNGRMPYLILRFGTFFGTSPGMRFHTAINKFCYQACVGESLTVWEQSYHQKRPYLDLADAISAIKLLITYLNANVYGLGWGIGDRAFVENQVFNVVSGNHTVAEVIQIIRKYIDVEIELVDTPLLNQHSYEVSCDKIAQLNYEPQGVLEDGIRQTIQLLSRIRRI